MSDTDWSKEYKEKQEYIDYMYGRTYFLEDYKRFEERLINALKTVLPCVDVSVYAWHEVETFRVWVDTRNGRNGFTDDDIFAVMNIIRVVSGFDIESWDFSQTFERDADNNKHWFIRLTIYPSGYTDAMSALEDDDE